WNRVRIRCNRGWDPEAPRACTPCCSAPRPEPEHPWDRPRDTIHTLCTAQCQSQLFRLPSRVPPVMWETGYRVDGYALFRQVNGERKHRLAANAIGCCQNELSGSGNTKPGNFPMVSMT